LISIDDVHLFPEGTELAFGTAGETYCQAICGEGCALYHLIVGKPNLPTTN
jgi:hypothetical protein